MTDAPERIWAWCEDDDFMRAKGHGVERGTEYIRYDIAPQVKGDYWKDNAQSYAAALNVVYEAAGQLLYSPLPAQENLPECGADPVTVAGALVTAMRTSAERIQTSQGVPRVNPAAVRALSLYQQADMDGIMVIVSRQAIEECLPALRALAGEDKANEPN